MFFPTGRRGNCSFPLASFFSLLVFGEDWRYRDWFPIYEGPREVTCNGHEICQHAYTKVPCQDEVRERV